MGWGWTPWTPSSWSSRWRRSSRSASRATRSAGKRSRRSPRSPPTSNPASPPWATRMPGADPKGTLDPTIVVTGLGAVTAFGWGAGPLWEGLLRGVPAISTITRFDGTRHRTHLAAEVPLGAAPAGARRAPWTDRFAVAAAREAMRQAGLRDAAEAGVYFGSSTGGMLESEAFYEALLRRGPRRARPSLLVAQQVNGPGDAVARDTGATGPVETVSSACSSGSMAIGAALRALRRGD